MRFDRRLLGIITGVAMLFGFTALAADPPQIPNVAQLLAYIDGSGGKQQVDPTHPLPVNVVSGGGGSAAAQNGTNAADGQASSTDNQRSVVFNYGYNGSTWDRARVGTGGAWLTIINASLPAGSNKIGGVTEADGDNAALGAKADAAAGTGAVSVIALSKQIHLDLIAPTPAGTAIIGKVGIDQTTHGTTDKVAADTYYAGSAVGATNPLPTGPLLYRYGSLPGIAGGFAYQPADGRGFPMVAERGSDDAVAGITPAVGTAATSLVGKAAQGNLYRAYAVSTTAPAAQQYLVCINATAAPSAGAAITPVDFAPFNLATTAGATASINFGPGPPSAYATGITCVVTTSLATFTAGTASNLNVAVR